ncbi:MAG: helix-turn-helix transcriptional regulator [Rhizobiales bacterium]|nr:helix-turn-helix transcriptional regulator [Hyphomicrobiales bacterium]MBO6699698.1 helix-turn-helix transcriptional regulator [Hyphomicrobiales bacterium]MBO6737236.1 helix-turn-helix transcriptional regulator [Hyphomicrobiales bacterium]MBO6911690.1 helix-turn-helix transcriptional regulator [Hyphomicrobiales bacterium]
MRPKVGVALGGLTDRQHVIARLVAQGKTSKHIARDLGISPLTVRTHRRNLFKVLGVHSVAELVQVVESIERQRPRPDTLTE